MMTVNDLLNLKALRDKVLITGYESGDTYYDGRVEDVPSAVKAMTPRLIDATADDYFGYDAFVQIEVDE